MHDTAALRGRTALVTGGARRVGAAIVRELHAAGASVAVHCHRSQAEASALVKALEAERPGSASLHVADLLDTAALPALVGAVIARHGALDILVNNASTFYPTRMGSIEVAAFDDLIGTNLKAPLFLAQAAAPSLRRAQGLVLNLVDIHGLRPLRDCSVYSVAKAGLIMLTRVLARELAPQVRVNGIAPGPVMWAEGENTLAEAQQQDIVARTLLKRPGSPEDIARTVRFFAADAPYVTGQILAVDGGRSVGW